MNARNPITVLRGRHATIFLEATIVSAQKDIKETEKDAVQNSLPNQGKSTYWSLH
jgi:hypothetical protein